MDVELDGSQCRYGLGGEETKLGTVGPVRS